MYDGWCQLPLRAIRQQVASAVDMVVHLERLLDGTLRVVQCAGVVGMEGDTIVMQDIFLFEHEGLDADGKIIGGLESQRVCDPVLDRISEAGITLPPSVFWCWYGQFVEETVSPVVCRVEKSKIKLEHP